MVTDTAFRKSSLRKFFLEKIVPGISKNWPYHTDLLVYCLKFKLSPVCESESEYYYNITNDCWALSLSLSLFFSLSLSLFLSLSLNSELGKSDLSNFGNLVGLLWHIV